MDITMKDEGAAQAPKQDKHLDVYQAIQEINSVVSELESLLVRISVPTPAEPENSKTAQCEPSLSEFLNGGAIDIRNKLDSAHHVINAINQELF